jgi:hypothetical protein
MGSPIGDSRKQAERVELGRIILNHDQGGEV